MLRHDPIPDLKQQLAAALLDALKSWKPADVRFYIKLDQPRLSDLRCGRLEKFSVERLIRFLVGLDCRVEICIEKPTRKANR